MDSRNCQTSTASPAKPGDFPDGLSTHIRTSYGSWVRFLCNPFSETTSITQGYLGHPQQSSLLDTLVTVPASAPYPSGRPSRLAAIIPL